MGTNANSVVPDSAALTKLAVTGALGSAVPPTLSPPPSSDLIALCTVARYHQIAADPATLAHQLGLSASTPIGTHELLRAAKHLGLKAKRSTTTPERLALTPLPALARIQGADGQTRTVILAQCDGQRVLYQDPDPIGAGGGGVQAFPLAPP